MSPRLRDPGATRSRSTAPPVPRSRFVQPDELAGPARSWFIWLTIVLVWMASLLPWRLLPLAPELLLLVIAFWAVNEPGRVGMSTAFVFGILMDVHDAALLGEHALHYTLVAYGGYLLHRRLVRFNVWAQTVHMLPVFLAASFLVTLLHAWVAGSWPGWSWLGATLVTVALWPLVGWLLQLPQRAPDAVDSSSP